MRTLGQFQSSSTISQVRRLPRKVCISPVDMKACIIMVGSKVRRYLTPECTRWALIKDGHCSADIDKQLAKLKLLIVSSLTCRIVVSLSMSSNKDLSAIPNSDLVQLRNTDSSGRTVIARKSIPKDTLILETSLLTSYNIYRHHRKEVCYVCFAYDRGVEWKVRDSGRGLVFCSENCQQVWVNFNGDDVCVAYRLVHEFTQKQNKHHVDLMNTEEEYEEGVVQPSPNDVATAWYKAEQQATLISKARDSSSTTKIQRRLINAVLGSGPHVERLNYFLTGISCAAKLPLVWKASLDLEETSMPYPNRSDLSGFVDSYLQLVALLPNTILQCATRSLCENLVSRAAHNAFSIRPSAVSGDEDEFLGWGVWPQASYFNHSCIPNLRKERVGRVWKFWTTREVNDEEELCISYLGGEETTLENDERRQRLFAEWGFDCHCQKCSLVD